MELVVSKEQLGTKRKASAKTEGRTKSKMVYIERYALILHFIIVKHISTFG